MKKFLKDHKGFAASDALIAVLIIVLFSGLIATISYNIYISNSSIKRMSKATGYIVDVFEYIDIIDYESVTENNLADYFNKKYYVGEKTEAKMILDGENSETINTPFKAEVDIVKYNETEGNKEKMDLVQEITMTVRYKLGNKDQEITMTRNKTK